MDLLVAPLYGPDGELRGTLSIDCPTDGRRPDEAHRRILNRYAEQAGRALYIAVEREAFAEQVRVLSATREVVRNAARERNIGVMLEQDPAQPDRRVPLARQLDPHLRRGRPRARCDLLRRRHDRSRCRTTWWPSPSAPPRTRGAPSGSGWCRGTWPDDPRRPDVSEPEFQADPARSSRGSASARCCSCRWAPAGSAWAAWCSPGRSATRSGPRPRSTRRSRSAATWAGRCSTPAPSTASASWSASSRRSTTTRAS